MTRPRKETWLCLGREIRSHRKVNRYLIVLMGSSCPMWKSGFSSSRCRCFPGIPLAPPPLPPRYHPTNCFALLCHKAGESQVQSVPDMHACVHGLDASSGEPVPGLSLTEEKGRVD